MPVGVQTLVTRRRHHGVRCRPPSDLPALTAWEHLHVGARSPKAQRDAKIAPRHRDAFPTTQTTFIGRLLDRGPKGHVEAGRHIMTVYAHPLRVYLAGSSFRTLGDASEIIDGFFADRLQRDGFLASWLESGHRLRYWLINAFKNYLHEQIRAARRQQRKPDPGRYEARRHEDNAEDPEAVFHHEAALAVVREAFRLAEQECRAVSLDDHWRAFVRHHLDGLDYRAIANELEVTPARAGVMARTATERFRSRLREMVAWAGASDQEIDQEINELMEALAS